MDTIYDVVIVGGGPAGLNAGLVLARARWSVLLLDDGHPRNAPAAHAHGFLSRDGVPPGDLLATGREEVRRYGAAIRDGRAAAAERTAQGFAVTTDTGDILVGRRLLVTSGLVDDLPPVDGLAERWGRDVLHCPFCHGWEVRDQRLAVLGSPRAAHQATLVRQWSDSVVLLADGATLDEGERRRLTARGVRIVQEQVLGLEVHDDRLRGVRVGGGEVVDCDALFVGPTFTANSGLLTGLGAELESAPFATWVRTDERQATTIPGVYAAGNVADPMALLIVAAATGAKAAMGITADLVEEDLRLAMG